ncbi:MAG: lipid A deacylase LpxR family protein [Pseudomonadales bacterium]
MTKYITAVSLFLFSLAASAEAKPWALNFYFENDLFADTDLNYTNGVRISATSPDVTDFITNNQLKHPALRKLSEGLAPLHPKPSARQKVHRNIVLSAGQLMFTPQDKFKQQLDESDRPYAGWLYAGIGYQARTADKLHTLELNLGVVGPAALARQTQNAIHDLRAIERFHGWDNQLKNEPGIQLIFERKRRFSLGQLHRQSGLQTDFISHIGASLGNVATYANAGGELRLGFDLPRDFGTSSLRPGADTVLPGRAAVKDKWQSHLFLAGDARLVAHNIFLDGNSYRDSHSVDKRHLVGDLAIGFSSSYNAWKFTYAHVYRSREFHKQAKAQQYGALSISYSY